jgi:hypothetical protein
MSRLAGVNHLNAVRAPEQAGFRVARQHNPVHSITTGNIVRDAGLTNEFRRLLGCPVRAAQSRGHRPTVRAGRTVAGGRPRG